MPTERERVWRFISDYQREHDVEEFLMSDVAQYAAAHGYKLPPPISGIEQLTKKFSRLAAEEIRYDAVTGRPYRANHARMTDRDGKQIPLWFDMDKVQRPTLEKYVFQRRQHVVQEMLQLTLDLDHWNAVHPNEEPVNAEPDLTDDIEWQKNSPDEGDKKAS